MSHHAKGTRLHNIGSPGHDRAVMLESQHDAYRLREKLPEPSFCPLCSAVYEQGRWQWKEPLSAKAPHVLCSACRRQRDHQPAGIVRLAGQFLQRHRDELLQRVRNHAEHARAEHPMQRIMAIEDDGDAVVITTTDVHLARGIGEAVHQSFRGTLEVKPSPQQDLMRVNWQR
jgi:cytochrome c553